METLLLLPLQLSTYSPCRGGGGLILPPKRGDQALICLLHGQGRAGQCHGGSRAGMGGWEGREWGSLWGRDRSTGAV